MKKIGGDVRRELERFGPVAAGMSDLVAAWPRLVGDQIARNAWPSRLGRDGTLHVATSGSAWAFELTQLAPELLTRLREGLGEAAPEALRFGPGKLPDPASEAPTAPSPAVPEPSPDDVERASELAATIEDESLRELVAKAAAASLARAADDRSFW
ncbi:MAG TPA: DUF721 domain-containing protein [Gaiellaceae bacterium]|nr:DUF721 domain-containing protein [Gaiellaceae bacterium]